MTTYIYGVDLDTIKFALGLLAIIGLIIISGTIETDYQVLINYN